MAPQPFYTTALEIPSNSEHYTPPFSPPPASDAASSTSEHRYLRQTRFLHYARLSLSLLVISLSASIIGCTASAIHSHHATHLGSEWWLPLWPANLDMRGVTAQLACAIAILVLNIPYLTVSVPWPRSLTLPRTLLYTLTSLLSLPLSLFSLAYTIHRTHINNHGGAETLESWTCHLSSSPSLTSNNDSNSRVHYRGTAEGAPDGFATICREMKASFVLDAIMAGLLVVACGVVMVGWWVEGRVRLARNREGGGIGVGKAGEISLS